MTTITLTAGSRPLPDVLRTDWIKLSTILANKATLMATALIGLVASWAVATFVTDEVLFVSDVYVSRHS